MARTTSIYLSDELYAAVRESGMSLPELVRLGLERDRQRRELEQRCERLANVVEGLTRELAEGRYRIVPAGQ
jgi:hypothetical protein